MLTFEEEVEKKFGFCDPGTIELKNKYITWDIHSLNVQKENLESKIQRHSEGIKHESEYYRKGGGPVGGGPVLGLVYRRDELRSMKIKLFVVKWLLKQKKKGLIPDEAQRSIKVGVGTSTNRGSRSGRSRRRKGLIDGLLSRY